MNKCLPPTPLLKSSGRALRQQKDIIVLCPITSKWLSTHSSIVHWRINGNEDLLIYCLKAQPTLCNTPWLAKVVNTLCSSSRTTGSFWDIWQTDTDFFTYITKNPDPIWPRFGKIQITESGRGVLIQLSRSFFRRIPHPAQFLHHYPELPFFYPRKIHNKV